MGLSPVSRATNLAKSRHPIRDACDDPLQEVGLAELPLLPVDRADIHDAAGATLAHAADDSAAHV